MPNVTIGTEAGDPRGNDIGDHGRVPERFASVNIGQVNLDNRNIQHCKRISDGDAGMGVGGRIDHHPMDVPAACWILSTRAPS